MEDRSFEIDLQGWKSSDSASLLGVCSLLEIELKLRRLRVKKKKERTDRPAFNAHVQPLSPKHRIARDDTKSGLEEVKWGLEDEFGRVGSSRGRVGRLTRPNEMTATLIHAEN